MKENNCKFLLGELCTSPINKNCKTCELIPSEMCYYKQLQEEKESSAMTSKIFATAVEQYQTQIVRLSAAIEAMSNLVGRQMEFNKIHKIADDYLKDAQITAKITLGEVGVLCQASGVQNVEKS